jgi:hypothetical protein
MSAQTATRQAIWPASICPLRRCCAMPRRDNCMQLRTMGLLAV